ncbi:peptidylprolyl isomerase [Paracoccus suum]|uniref:Peptidylprolyl isomerase n=2 Tax=Paracoccus suum TaxID=2259340 RepID=A0A344PK91_9RHOB|nr:peptidylprolyl isomerase [Paracoccus suum]
MTRRGKSAINWILMGFILLGLGGWGVSNFTGPSQGSIGAVGSTEIKAADYARALQAEMRSIQSQTGQPMTAETARAMGLPQSVQQRLITASALEEEARQMGLSVGDRRVADQIMAAPAFQGIGGFDRARYADTLRNEQLSEPQFERDVRMDEARLLLQRAVTGATAAPAGAVAQTTRWLTETRDLTWSEVTADQLDGPVTAPDDATLQAWHQANASRFTKPETRHISYAWLTPEMLENSVQLDETALRQLYEERKDEFQQPERRMVDRLVYPDQATAEAAKARLDKGEVDFDALVAERGLTRQAIDLGEVTQAQLGAAGAAVFATEGNGVVGPVPTDLGPALFSVNAILDPVNVGFEAAQTELRAEAALDKAKRDIEGQSAAINDLLAGGASLDDLAKETPMKRGEIDWQEGETPAAGSIATYPAFRTRVETLTDKDYPELFELDDGGIFAMTLTKVTPAAVIPFDQVRDRVLADWTTTETHKRLLALADKQRLSAEAEAGQAAGTKAPGLGRDGAIDGAPAAVVTEGFALKEAGDGAVVDADGRVFIVTLDAVHEADPKADQTVQVASAVSKRQTQTLAEDYFDFYTRALVDEFGLHLNQQAAAAVDARMQ